MYDITILIPAIRQNRWLALYESAKLACKNHKWEMVLVSPFDLPETMKDLENIRVVTEFGNVSRAVQLGMQRTYSPLVFLTVDDCVFREDSIDEAMEDYRTKCRFMDALNVRYSEGGNIMPEEYYRAYTHVPLRMAGIDPSWQLAPQFIINQEYFIALGGFDCQFEYINESVHDFMFRLQKDGGRVEHSTGYCCIATWYPNTTGDHAPIHYAQTGHDWPIFVEMYNKPNNRQTLISYANWKQAPEIWERRFSKGVPNSYAELVEQEGYRL